ncbi:hypothetical protein E0W60_07385 [Cupriavidus oxalaticus]|uniref:Uncharacterized protein n=1 Tax=Cupriavidus oxalaticus TaxID=96344 RepID=A0A4P7LD24_9BURK|nr:hypothetical protein E0W60_07385 [Cupriavidus oxalaticus]
MLAVYSSSFILFVLSQLFDWRQRRSEIPSRMLHWLSVFAYSTSLLVMVCAVAKMLTDERSPCKHE